MMHYRGILYLMRNILKIARAENQGGSPLLLSTVTYEMANQWYVVNLEVQVLIMTLTIAMTPCKENQMMQAAGLVHINKW